MKGYFRFITESNGFILLHILFIIAILFLLVTGSIFSYRNEVHITETQVEQIHVESLFQMSRLKYVKEQMQNEEILQTASYDFPNGDVDIRITHLSEAYRKLQFHINPSNQESLFTVNHVIKNEMFRE
ncbi:hypothetical protein [Oceanobacillus alkalisoli]|uniref:hypothetical protein n=1 Tax=Oceanobacillus alkalisoli TaxID=2925113 RepID=UPI001EF088AD|nr:hypothetical protein [Oceanobacillus alkalisoli]MCF3941765.1 hypothetical protein [Oceanobacillus alkalisoli]MCG5103045.1 hypothetical protein [Oceanobacillus alkalisoli]